MSYIVRYQKLITRDTTKMLRAPEGSTELCEFDGLTYVSVPTDALIDVDQYPEVSASIEVVQLDSELLARVSAASTHVALIRERVRTMIADQYSVYEEIKLLRTAPSPEFDLYNEHVELCRQWGRDQKIELGLVEDSAI